MVQQYNSSNNSIIFPLLYELHQKIIPYFIIELKFVKQIGLKLRSIFQGQGYEWNRLQPNSSTRMHGAVLK